MARLLDHLVGGHQQRLRDRQAERFCGFEVDGQIEFCRLLDRQVGRTWRLSECARHSSGRLRDKQQRRRRSSSGRRQRRTFYEDIFQEFYGAPPTLKSCRDCVARRKEERHRRRTRRLHVRPGSRRPPRNHPRCDTPGQWLDARAHARLRACCSSALRMPGTPHRRKETRSSSLGAPARSGTGRAYSQSRWHGC